MAFDWLSFAAASTGAEPVLVCWVLVLALLIDRYWGEPPVAWHPVVWMGHYLAWMGRRVAPQVATAPVGRDWRAGIQGALAWCLGALLVVGVAVVLQTGLRTLPTWLAVLLLGLCLKPLFAWRMLRAEVLAVEAALGQSLAQGRERLSWLCSRDTVALSETEVRETALESLAENFNDSVIAPLFWFAVAGLPGAALYRFANTADAMWGYRGERQGRYWEWAGKWAAHADDALSWLPARLSALCLLVAVGGMSVSRVWRQARLTPSPNGGWPMGALALALDVRLGKPGVYALNATGRLPVAADVQHACRLTQRAVWCGLLAWLLWSVARMGWLYGV